MSAMSGANPLPKVGDVFFDARGEDRALRLSWHPDAQVMVLSIWNRGVCSGTFRLPAGDVPAFVEALSQGLPPVEPRGRRHAAADDAGPGPTTQALDALKSLSATAAPSSPPPPQPRPRPQPQPQPQAHPQHPQRPQQGWPEEPPDFPMTGEYHRPPPRR